MKPEAVMIYALFALAGTAAASTLAALLGPKAWKGASVRLALACGALVVWTGMLVVAMAMTGDASDAELQKSGARGVFTFWLAAPALALGAGLWLRRRLRLGRSGA